VLGDHHGNVVHLGERECSIQRRHQKLLEESPSVVVTDKIRREMGNVVADAARAVQYTNAGTFEFLMDAKGNFYFMEVNTRVQVEHPVTEMVTGIDIVKEQIRVAAGERLSFKQSEVTFTGTRSNAASTPRIRKRSCRHRARFTPSACPAARRAHRHGAHSECTISAVLRLDDRQGHRARPRSPGSHRADEADARDVHHRRHPDDDSAAPEDPRRSGLHRRPAAHALHGAVSAEASHLVPRRKRIGLASLASFQFSVASQTQE
jgi:hypothetical protein